MATLSITIPADQVNRVQDALCAQYGYERAVAEDPGLTKTAFVKGVVINFIKQSVKGYEIEQAAQTARTTAEADAEAGITLS